MGRCLKHKEGEMTHFWRNTKWTNRLIVTAIVALVLAFHYGNAEGQTSWTLELQSYQRQGAAPDPFLSAYTTHKLGEKVSVASFVAFTKTWGEGLAGPAYILSTEPFIEIGLMAGFEQPNFGVRGGGSLFAERNGTTLFGFYERGAGTDNHWYVATLLHEVGGGVSVGLHAQRFQGIGGRANISSGPLTFWVAPVWNPESNWARGLATAVSTRF